MKDEKWTKNGRVGNDDENTDRGVFEAIERSCLLDERGHFCRGMRGRRIDAILLFILGCWEQQRGE